jgi:hypothetical protein
MEPIFALVAVALILGIVGFFIGGGIALKENVRHKCSKCTVTGRGKGLTSAGRSAKVPL